MTTSRIPIIDLSAWREDPEASAEDVAARIRAALEDVGFMVLTGHGVAQPLVEAIFDETVRFHAQPLAAKMALAMNEHNNGYMAKGRYAVWTSEVNDNDQPDLNESFFVKRERARDDPQVRPGRLFVGPNLWPESLPGFRETVLDYCRTLDTFAMDLLPLMSRSLDLEPGYFTPLFQTSQFSLRLTHYPPESASDNQYGIAPHTDSNFLTFLPQHDEPGLEVRMPDGSWEPVPCGRGSIAVNTGDMMKRWTNHRFKSTPHRVLPPRGRHRYSVAFFFGPNIDTRIECLETCTAGDNPPRQPPIRYEDWINYWYKANYDPAIQAGEDAAD
jgi:isopenicillin N synthase-like dioxygenase